MKNHFLGPSRVREKYPPLWALFSFFPFFLLFFSSFFCLFSCFLFSHFLFISSFFCFFNVFHFLFSFFPKKKVSSFLFCCISFIFLLALVSEFNCFLRSRCSMEMWCPDDIGWDSWDWVGPPAWVRACFNSPDWGGGSSPVKTEPPQIVLLFVVALLLCCFCVVVVLLLCCCAVVVLLL